jgi:hypothetical protein
MAKVICTRLAKVLVVVLSSIVLLLGVEINTTDRPASAATDWVGSTYSATARAFASEYGLGPGEAARRLDLQPVIGSLQQRAREAFPYTFAGMWVAPDLAGSIQLSFTAGAASALSLLETEFPLLHLEGHDGAARNERELDELLATAVAERENVANALGIAALDIAVDVPGNGLHFRFDGVTDERVAYLADRYDAPVVAQPGPSQPDACASRADCDPMRGGLRITTPIDATTIGICSTAFNVIHFDFAGIQREGVVTAAHCGGSYSQWFHGQTALGDDRLLGYMIDRQFFDRLDAGLIDYDANQLVAPSRLVYESPSFSPAMTSVESYGAAFVGEYVCRTGQTTATRCGNVTHTNVSPSYVHNGRNFVAADYCSEGGDSGGSVYSGNMAIGVHSGGAKAPCGDPNDYGVYGHAEWMQRDLGVVIRTR